jgi:GTP cyclohydrolase II
MSEEVNLEEITCTFLPTRFGKFTLCGFKNRADNSQHLALASVLQDQEFDSVTANHHLEFDADLRNYSIGIRVLKRLEITTIALLTNNLNKLKALKNANIKIVERVPLQVSFNTFNLKYLQNKKEKIGQQLIDL